MQNKFTKLTQHEPKSCRRNQTSKRKKNIKKTNFKKNLKTYLSGIVQFKNFRVASTKLANQIKNWLQRKQNCGVAAKLTKQADKLKSDYTIFLGKKIQFQKPKKIRPGLETIGCKVATKKQV